MTYPKVPTTDILISNLKTKESSSPRYPISSTPRFLSTLTKTKTVATSNELSTPKFISTPVQHVTSDHVFTSSNYPLIRSSISSKKLIRSQQGIMSSN